MVPQVWLTPNLFNFCSTFMKPFLLSLLLKKVFKWASRKWTSRKTSGLLKIFKIMISSLKFYDNRTGLYLQQNLWTRNTEIECSWEKGFFFFLWENWWSRYLNRCLFQVVNMKKNGFCICRMLEMLDTSLQAELVKNETFIFKFRWVIVPSALGPSPPDKVNTTLNQMCWEGDKQVV